ncbi:MAG: sigma-70 family RNA polymerase sigma factor [Planctomycetaceae bacterium]|nr:sigma-70 family RNA polymerase sigma factor [Planctomycetaceae bacterium]
MDAAQTTRYSLLLRIADPQNHAAWIEFLGIYEPLVYQLARRKGLQDADARDLCQEVFRAVAGAARRWTPDPDRGSFRGWLYRIASNRLVNSLRYQQRHGRAAGGSDIQRLLEVQPDGPDGDTQEIDTEYRRRLFQLAARSIEHDFSRSTWQAFWQTAVLSRDVASVAAELGLSAGAVYIARSRVLSRLRRRVQELAGEEE